MVDCDYPKAVARPVFQGCQIGLEESRSTLLESVIHTTVYVITIKWAVCVQEKIELRNVTKAKAELYQNLRRFRLNCCKLASYACIRRN